MSNEYPPQNGHHAHQKHSMTLPKPSAAAAAAAAAPKSTLANLLSSQRRSIAQSARHKIQIARPFANSAFIERAAERAIYNYSLPPTNKRSNESHGAEKVAAHTISSKSTINLPVQESRRVTFLSSTPLESTPTNNTMKQDGGTRILGSRFTPPPSRKRSRWGPPVEIAGGGVRVTTEWRSTEKLLVHQSPQQMLIPPPQMSNSVIRQTNHLEDGNTACNNKQQTLQFITAEEAATAATAAKQSTLDASTMTTINQQTTIHKTNQLHSTIANDTTKKSNYSNYNDVTINQKQQIILSMDQPNFATIAKIPMKKGNALQSEQCIFETLNKCDAQLHDKMQSTIPRIVKKNVHRNSYIDEDDRLHMKQSQLDSSLMNDVLYQSSRPTIKQNDYIHKRSNAAQNFMYAAPPTKQTKKNYNPFRVKTGCVVTVRFRKLIDGGNNKILPVVQDGENCFRLVDDHLLLEQHREEQLDITTIDKQNNGLDDDDPNCGDKSANSDMNHHHRNVGMKQYLVSYEVWSTPIPGQDDGLSLLGSWIRCMFSKSYIKKWQRMNSDIQGATNQPPSAMGRVVEGNVISILDSDGCKPQQSGITVCLLIDRIAIQSLPFLQVLSDIDTNDTRLGHSEQKRRILEAQIRGLDKLIVQISLASVYQQRTKSKLDDEHVVTQWMVRKRVFANPRGDNSMKEEKSQRKQSSNSLYVGDGNDEQRQQEKNWIWIASHTLHSLDDMNKQSCNVRDTTSQLVGEVVRIDTAPSTTGGGDTIARVIIKRLWTPEQIQGGRMSHHNPLELFDNFGASLFFQAPIEDLIVIGKRVARRSDDTNKSDDVVGTQRGDNDDTRSSFHVTHSYQARDNIITPLYQGDNILEKSISSYHDSSSVCHPTSHTLSTENTNQSTQLRIGQVLAGLVTSLQSVACVDFTLPTDVGKLSLRPSFLAGHTRSKCYIKKTKNEVIKKGQLDMDCVKCKKLPSTKAKSTTKKLKRMLLDVDLPNEERPQVSVINSHCHRTISFHQLDKSSWGSLKMACEPYFRENCLPRSIGKSQELPTTLVSGRAARANLRRMNKSFATLGDTFDRLAGRVREQHLRFDKSQIHGWGVYAETPISMGDMIIEYRGELIGNAVADKREREYEKSKLDDYMFRIDTCTVCDATILGNVARYINASCSPNCYTQIIIAGKNKRIVIYAKRDIQRGEELCYDYKFNLEEDQCKRIPCHCGAVNCRGFMN